MSKTYLIICDTILVESRSIIPDDMIIMRQSFSLHEKPDLLRSHLQEVIDGIPGKGDTIVLGYGLCSNATVGLTSAHHRLILPRIHDCIALFCGSQACFEKHRNEAIGTLFLTKRFIESEDGTYHLLEYDKYIERYGEELAQQYTRMVLEHYERAAVVDTGEYDTTPYKELARKFCELYDLEYHEITGDQRLMLKLFTEEWDHEVIVKEPGEEVSLLDYFSDAQ